MLLAGIVAAMFGLFAVLANNAQAGAPVKFTVNSSLDDSDAVPGDGVCDNITGPPVICTFRAGIEESNALNGHNVLNFTATNTTAGSTYDAITERITIDASANPDGFSIDADFNCDTLELDTGSSLSVIRGLTIFNDDCDGLQISDGAAHTIGGDRSVGAAPNGQGNTFHSNCSNGIEITGGLGGHVIQGNNIGPVKDGLSPGGPPDFSCDQSDGIFIDGGTGSAGPIVIGSLPGGAGAAGALIGDFANLISANQDDGDGITNSSGSADLHIDGNWIGLNINGSASDPMANEDDGIDLDGGSGDATIQNNIVAGGGVQPDDNPGDDGILIEDGYSGQATVLGNCVGFDSDCQGVTGGFNDDGIDIDFPDSDGHVIGSDTGAAGGLNGGNVVGNIDGDGIDIDGDSDGGNGNDVNGNVVGFGVDGEEGALVEDDCVDLDGENNRIRNNNIGNCGDEAVDIQCGCGDDGGNEVTDNDIGFGTNDATSDPVDNHCIEINSEDGGNEVRRNVMKNCDLGDDFSATPNASIQIDDSPGNIIQGNDITSPPNADAIDIIGGAPSSANLIASDTFRMVNQVAGDLPIDLDDNGVTINDGGDGDPGVANVPTCDPVGFEEGANLCHNYPVFSPSSPVNGCARGSAGPFDAVRIYIKETSGNQTIYRLGEKPDGTDAVGQANLAGDFEICLNETAKVTVVGTSTTTVSSTTDTACIVNCTSEFSVTEQTVQPGATPTPTATDTPPPTDTPTITNTPPPTNTPTITNTPVPPTPVPPTDTPTPSKECGDVNDNGSVDAVDALLVLQLSAGLVDSLLNEPSADTNNDGTINPVDAALILQVEAALIALGDLDCG